MQIITNKSKRGFQRNNILSMSRLDDIKMKEIQSAISFYMENGLSKEEASDKISSYFSISMEEIKRIIGE